MQKQPDLSDLMDRMQAIADAIHAQCNAIADEIAEPRRMNRARVAAAQNLIQQEIHRLNRFFPEFDAAYHAAATLQPTAAGARTIVPPDWLAASARVGHMRNWANGWVGIRELIGQQCPPRRRPLDVPPEKLGPVAVAAASAGDRLVNRLHAVLNPYEQSERAAEYGCFADIALPHSTFMALALAAWRILAARGQHAGTRFIDVGCGGGLKVLSALEFFDSAAGLEFDPAYARAARELFARAGVEEDATVIEGDALDFDGYGSFDVVYFHRPMSEPETLWQLEERIVGSVPAETLLIAPYDQFSPRAEVLGCAEICHRIYLAQGSSRQAATLRRDAELIGTNLRPTRPPLRTIWAPILDVSRRRGF